VGRPRPLSDGVGQVLRIPAECGCDLAGDRLEHGGVVVDAEPAGNREEDRVGGLNGGVFGEVVGDLVGLAGVAAAEAADRTSDD
jgi:hypothetical protein